MRTRILLLCCCVVSFLYSVAQPPINNPCGAAIAITTLDGTCTTGNLITGATEDIASGACSVGSNENVWFSFTAQGVSAEIEINNAPGTPEITLIQFTGGPCNLGGAVEINCITGSPLIINNQLVVGTTYYVMVAFSNDPDGTFDICIDNPVPAPNDACITATQINNLDNACISTTNDWPSTDVLTPGCFTGTTWNVWYSFVAQGVSLDLNIPAGGPGNAQFAVIDFATACTSAGSTVLGCATGTNHIVLDNELTIGDVYYIVVGFPNGNFDGTGIGNFDLCIDNPEPAPNDDCDMAIAIPTNVLNDPTTCYTTIAGNPLNNDFPSTDDLGTFNCWNPGDSYNIWYSFVAQGPDVQITVDPVFAEDAQIALVQFTGTPCVNAGATLLDCANGTVLDFNDELIEGQTYYIAVGFEDNMIGNFCMNVFNPMPPPNDMPCDAITLNTNGNCEDGTTVYANPEELFFPGSCQSAVSNIVWYEVNLSDPDNVGYEIDLSFADVSPGMTVSVFLYPGQDCNNPPNPSFFYCGAPPTEPLEFGPVQNIPYLLAIGTSEPYESDFEVCVDEIPPCFTNDICEEATVVNGVTSDAPFVCVEGCNLFADPEAFNNSCGVGNFSTVWFQVPTDGNASLMNIFVNSDDFTAPTISLFWQTSDCSALTPVPLTNSNLPCIVGSGGEAEALGTDVGANAIYYIAVSSLNSTGGEFELCVNTISSASLCVTSRDIEITSRSSGGPLEGPFFPGETVSVCLNVNSYTAANNGCQWFQGMIPVFGNGWDPSSFDGEGQPSMNATINGENFGVPNNGIYGTATWDWFTDVDYHYNHVFYQLGDFDGNGSLDMCNLLYDPDCPNTGGLMGGCCNPCWGTPLGTILPGGWFAYGINGSCGVPGPPIRVDWGDGNTCGGGMGAWEFCFDLQIRDYPDCLEDNTTMDLKIGFFTTADGETGAWTGNASICALDQPAFLSLPMCCSELDEGFDELDPICSGQQFVYSIDEPGVEFWTWSVDAPGTTGATPGQGGPGTLIINTLTNTSGDPEVVTYTFLGFAGGACPVFQKEVMIEVYPKIVATLDPIVMCATPNMPYTLTPDVMGGTGTYYYQWAPNGESSSSISVPNPVNGTTYIVTVTDDAGCFATASVTISVYTTFPVDIIAPVVEQCIQDGPIIIEATAMGGMDPYSFEWTTPTGTATTEEITSDQSGQHLVVVTDDEGCVGKDSVTLTLNESPEVFIDAIGGILALCENQSTQLTGVATMGESPYIYEWDTPDGPESGKTITAFNPGIFTVTVEDANGCTAVNDLAIEAQPEPEPDLGPDIQVCNFEYEVELSVTEQFEDYEWSIGAAGDGLQTIGVYAAGVYTVSVTNEYGCIGTDDVEITTFPQPVFPIPDTFEICPGATITIDVDDYGGPWDNFIWTNCPGCFNEVDVTGPDAFTVTVFDENGCTGYAEFEVVETSTISPGLTGDNIICVSSGEVSTLSAQTGFASYDWAPGNETTSSIDVTMPGTYIVTVEDDEGCLGIDSIIVVSGDFTASVTGPASICSGALATITAQPNFSTYLWGTSATTQSIMVDDGTHSVTVTNVDGCTSVASITIAEMPFVPVITGDNVICQTSESTVLDAGGPHTSYQWSANAGGATTQTITTSTAGTYSVTVTDLAGCVGNTSFNVTNHPVPFVAVAGNPDFCVGGNTEASATAGYVDYVWSTTETNDTIQINTPGLYTVTITDANGCTNTAATTVNPPYQETVDITGSFVFCPGDQATLEVPAGYSSVLWSTSETSDQIFVTTDGEVSVIVVDVDGCIAYDTVLTQANSVLSPNIVGPAVICDSGPGVLNAGPGFDTYTWSNGLGTNQTASITMAGTYTVTVTDGSCSGTDDFVVTSNASPTATVTPDAVACNIQETGGPSTIVDFNGQVTAGDTGGNWVQTGGPGTVSLANLGAVNFSGQVPGVYTFTYTTASAMAPCTNRSYSMTVTVNDCSCPPVDLGIAPDLCNDLGSINLNTLLASGTQTGGTWTIVAAPAGSNPATVTSPNLNAANADPGTYTLQYQVTGLPSYCPDAATININVLRDPVAGIAAPPVHFCAGENQSVDLFTMLIGADNGGIWYETSQNMSTGGAFDANNGKFNVMNQAPGTYTFSYVVSGPGPCPDDMTTIEVIIENNPVADAGATATLDCNLTTVTIGGNGTSQGPEFVYTWTTMDGMLSATDILNPQVMSQGTYVLTVMNTLTGCMAMDQVTIDQIGNFPTVMQLNIASPDCEGDPPGSMQVTSVTGGVLPLSYSLNGAPPVSNPNFNDLEPGDYTIEVTDATGCSLTETFTIYDLVTVDIAIINYVGDTLVFDFEDTIKLSYQYIGSTPDPDSLVWKYGDSVICTNCQMLEFPALFSGQITLEAWDVRGCYVKKSINYLVVRKRDVYIPNVFSPNGDGLNDFFTMYTDSDVKEIALFEVFTRWGDLVFRAMHVQPNDDTQGWDGSFRGEELNPGVYVYRMQIVYGDDLVDNLAGDITIVK